MEPRIQNRRLPAHPAQLVHHSIFRAEAVQHYLEERVSTAVPSFHIPRQLPFVWGLLVVLVVIGAVGAWHTQLPVYASGSGVVVPAPRTSAADRDAVVLVAFLPPEHLHRLRMGQPLLTRLEPSGETLRWVIIDVAPQISSPAAARRQFGLADETARAITRPAAVVTARLEPVPDGLAPMAYVGGVYQVDIVVGSRRLGASMGLIENLAE